MRELVANFAGKERTFHLRLGEYADIQTVTGVGIGVVYKRLASLEFYIKDVEQVLISGLVGGGMPVSDANRIVREQLDYRPLMEMSALASDVMIAAMNGIEPDDLNDDPNSDGKIDIHKTFHSFLQLGLAPQQVREMEYADYVGLLRVAGGKDVQPPTEAEFEEMVRNWEANNAGEPDGR